MKLLLASDSYKGSLSTMQVAEQIKKGVRKVYADAEFMCVPVADGGEGTVEAMVSSLGGEYRTVVVTAPNGKKIEAVYGVLPGKKIVIEMAAASGLPLIPAKERDVMSATTYGTGELIRAALDEDCSQIYIGIGGSATNDGGLGMAQALGYSFLDKDGREIGFGGKELCRVETIDTSKVDKRLKGREIIVMCDVINPLCGELGAAAVYGPQKGATPEQILELDRGLKHFAEVIKEQMGMELENMRGAGAAGGLGAGLVAFAGAKIKSGIDAILEVAGFEEKLKWADIVITGEGKIDRQSAFGKVISGISKMAKDKDIPVVAVSGSIEYGAEAIYEKGVTTMEAAVCKPMHLDEAIQNAEVLVENAIERVMRSIQIGQKIS
ncbi:MAG: glycerate kinase [Eubacteriales bacterium]|nr:glycerate kinase [Eubacteriales bacterium]